MKTLSPVVLVDKDKCVNCHACIAKCPVKYCNDASGDYIKINDDLCIGCGQCIKACTHGARIPVDDFENFLHDLRAGVKIVAVVAPAVAANFQNYFLNFNGWLRSLGVAACFDVSFGAELTVKSYLEHVNQNQPACVIAQPCPAIVSYIETHRPELLPYLAPADSPMLHMIKMIREFYPQYSHHKIAVVSPCIAKKREFVDTGLGDYNVTIASLKEHLHEFGITLNAFPACEYDNPPAERAVLFSTPGGLMRTAERWSEGLRKVIRKIEGPETIYPYLDQLKSSIDAGTAPLIVDCLNCEAGCNGGTGCGVEHSATDALEYPVEKRAQQMREHYVATGPLGRWRGKRKLEKLIHKFWKPGLYDRAYQNRSLNNSINTPDQRTLEAVYRQMSKTSQKDIMNCSSCGYNSCEAMAIAVHNGLNQPINCHHHVASSLNTVAEQYSRSSSEQVASIERASSAMSEVHSQTQDNARNAQESAKLAGDLREMAQKGYAEMNRLMDTMSSIRDSGSKIAGIVKLIDDIAFQTNLLALNAAVEAARAGRQGKGFAVVANEVRNLANRSSEAAHNTTELVSKSTRVTQDGEVIAREMAEDLKKILEIAKQSSQLTEQIYNASQEQAIGTEQIGESVRHIDGEMQKSAMEAENILSNVLVRRTFE